jgi:hypothetical protein
MLVMLALPIFACFAAACLGQLDVVERGKETGIHELSIPDMGNFSRASAPVASSRWQDFHRRKGIGLHRAQLLCLITLEIRTSPNWEKSCFEWSSGRWMVQVAVCALDVTNCSVIPLDERS